MTRTFSPLQQEVAAGKRMASLEILRFVAAMYVLFHHEAQIFKDNGIFWKLIYRTGQAPVMIFFILSGFVIGLRYENSKVKFGDYMKARSRRLFPVFWAVLAMGTIMALQKIVPYNLPDGIGSKRDLIGTLLMLQGPNWMGCGLCVTPWAGVATLWSLSFEWWFYIAFWLLTSRFTLNQCRWIVIGLASIGTICLAFSNQFPFLWLMLLCLWWSGVEMAKGYLQEGRIRLKHFGVIFGALILIFVFNLSVYVVHHHMADRLNKKGFMEWIGFGIVAALLSIPMSRTLKRSFGKWDGWFCKLGALSYAIYASQNIALNIGKGLQLPPYLYFAVCTLLTLSLAAMLEYVAHPIGSRFINRIWPKSAVSI